MALTTNLLSYWKLDEASGNASDATASAKTLTNNSVTYQAGKINNGALFDTTSDNLTTTSYTTFDFERTDSFSFSFWVNLTSVGANQFFISHQDNGASAYEGYSMYQAALGTLNFDFYNTAFGPNGCNPKSGISVIGTGWTHVVWTYAGTSLASGFKLYVNNVDTTITASIDNLSATTKNTNDFRLGNRATGFNMNGMLDEVGVWSRVLTSGEVTSLYNGGAGLPYPFTVSSTKSGFLTLNRR